MIRTSEIEDSALTVTFGALCVAANTGNLICAQIAPALREEIERRKAGALPSHSEISLEMMGIAEDDFRETKIRLLALRETWRKLNHPNALRFVEQILILVKEYEPQATPPGGRA